MARTTRTHTVYFDHEALGPVTAALQALAGDWEARRPHMSEDTFAAGAARLAIAAFALALLGEPVAHDA